MQQLSEMDASFLQLESKNTPMHISPVVVYDQSRRKGKKITYQDIYSVFQHNLPKSAIFRRKLAGGALGFDTPYWVEDASFDLRFHLREVSLPKPGSWRQFCDLLGRLQSCGLDMKKPLWEAYIITGLNKIPGLPKGSFAIMTKIHHAAIDGVSGAEIITAIHSLTDELEPVACKDSWRQEEGPSQWEIWSNAYMHNIKRPLKLLDKVNRFVPAVIRAAKKKSSDDIHQAPPLVSSRFNGRVTSDRVVDALVIDFDLIKAIRKTVEGVTVNDVMVSIIGGGLRKYLQSEEELPETTLSCGAPISMRVDHDSGSSGNQVSQMTISMATDVEDPIERLLAVHSSALEAKAFATEIGSSMMMEVSEVVAPRLMGWALQAATYAASNENIPMPSHTIISNVPGPQIPLYMAGAQVYMMLGIGPIINAMGLFHAVLSGAEKITITFCCCKKMLPDPEYYQKCLQHSLDELCAKVGV
jgi:WS/DGAT/MGAT family acyltransferase